jgi:dCMP deaminase
MRPSRHQVFMEVARVFSTRATCFRLNVGAVLTEKNRIVSAGYNGVAAGEPHCKGNDCEGRFGCHLTTHAEDNALRHLPAGSDPDTVYVTHSPCMACAKLLTNRGIYRIFFAQAYRDTAPLDWLINERQVQVYQVLPAGWILDWKTKLVVEDL